MAGLIGGEGSVWNRKGKKGGGAASPSGSLGLFGVRGANRGEPRDHLPLPPKEGRVDRQLTRNRDFAGLEVGGKD